MQEIDTTKTIELEEKYDPEMRFRPLVPPASLVVGTLLIILSCFHYYTAGFGLLRETTHRGIHLAFVLGLVFLVFPARKSMLEARAQALVAVARRRAARRLAAGARDRRVRPLHPVDLRGPRVPRGQSAADRRRDGVDPRRAAARGDAARDGLAAAGDRDRVHDLRARGPGLPRSAQAFRRAVVEPRQPPLHDEPGHLRDRGRRRRDLRVPFRAVRRARHAHRLGPALHRHRLGDRRPLRRRPGEGQRLRLGALRHAVGLVGRQCRDGRIADDPRDDPPRLSAPLRGRRRSGIVDRRPDHAADHGRGGVPDDRVPEPAVPDDHHRGDRARVHALLRRVHAGAFRGEAHRPARPHAGGAARRRQAARRQLADADPARAPHRDHRHGLDTLPRGVHRHLVGDARRLLHHARAERRPRNGWRWR